MKASFLHLEKPPITVLLSRETPEAFIEAAQAAFADGADAVCYQTCRLKAEYRTPETYKQLFDAAQGRPIYVTNYRKHTNEHATDEEIAAHLLVLAQSGATLCDVMGDLFDRQEGEMTFDPAAIERQKQLIDELHTAGAEVLMSSHVLKFTPAEQVLRIALAQQERGADIVKIVTGAETMEQQIENLRITALLKQALRVPFLFLSGGVCQLHRRIGPQLGCCMYLSSQDYNAEKKPVQPFTKDLRAIVDHFG